MVEEVVCAPVERRRRDQFVARIDDIKDRISYGSLARGGCERPCPFLQGCNTFLEHGLGGVHNPGIDIPDFFEREKPARPSRVTQH